MLWSLEGIYGFLVRIACICDQQRRDNRSGTRDPDSLIEKYRMLLHAICLEFKKIAWSLEFCSVVLNSSIIFLAVLSKRIP